MAYSNSALRVHGTGCLSYKERPNISININVSDITRSGETIFCSVSASINALGRYSYFGYNLSVYAELDDGQALLIASKGNSPNKWSSSIGSAGTKQLSAYNVSDSCTLHILLSSNCSCHGGAIKEVQSIPLNCPGVAKYDLILEKGEGVASFTGGGVFQKDEQVTTKADVYPGYMLSKYVEVNGDKSVTKLSCAGKFSHKESWIMSDSITVTAYAEPITYVIKYDSNGGVGTMESSFAKYKQPFTTSPVAFRRAGCIFAGWNTSADGSGQSFTVNSSGVYEGTWYARGNQTFYAQWSRIEHVVTYDGNGGSQPPSPQIKYGAVDLVITSETPKVAKMITVNYNPYWGIVERDHDSKYCGFRYWNTQRDGRGTIYSSGSIYRADSSLTLYAIWSSVSFSLLTPIRDRCVFVGWFTAMNGGLLVTDRTVFTEDSTIYARWDYLVHYDLNGGYLGDDRSYGDTIPDSIKNHNQPMLITTVQPTKEGLEFLGWSTSPDGSVIYTSGSSYTNDEPITLYAIYDVPTFKVTFDLRGGTSTGGSLVQYVKRGHNAILPNDPTRPEYQFKGWIGDYTNICRDTVVYALWNGSPVWIKKSDNKWHSYLDK